MDMRSVLGNIVIEPLWEQDLFVAIRAVDKAMQVQNSKRAKPFLVVVHSPIVYQIIEFSPSLALHLTAYSVRDAGLRHRQAFGGRAATSCHADTWEGMPVIRMVVFDMDGVLCRYQIERRLTLLNGEPACPTLHGTWSRL